MNFSPMSRYLTFLPPSSSLAMILFVDGLDDGGDAVGDLLGAMAAGVVRADHEDGDLGGDAVEFAVLDAPEDVLGLIAADAEVGGLQGTEGFVPDFLAAAAAPAVGDGIAEEEDVNIAFLGDLDKAFVAFDPALVARAGGGGGILLVAGLNGIAEQDKTTDGEGDEQLTHGGTP
jgi:hypothetical protein